MDTQTNRRSDLTDAALLVEELAEIYTTPTPKGRKLKSKCTSFLLIAEM